MGESDPHLHVTARTGRDDAVVRNVPASAFGPAGDLPSPVPTGCGERVPCAMTSPHPQKVTCPACREHARRERLRLAERVGRPGGRARSGRRPRPGEAGRGPAP